MKPKLFNYPQMFNSIKQVFVTNSSIILTLVFFVACLGISEVTITSFNQQQNNKSWQAADIKAKEIIALLNLKLSEIYKVNILNTYIVTLNGKVQPAEIEAFLASLYKESRYISTVSIAPNNKITYLYPLAGNEKTLGLHYKDNLAQWPVLEHAIQEHTASLAGPLQLVGGTSGFIYLVPVFLSDGTYWGVINAVLNITEFLSVIESEINKSDFQVALRNKDGNGADSKSVVFYGTASFFNGDGVHLTIPVPNGNWELVVKPIGGVSNLAKSFHMITLAVSLIVSLLIYQFLSSKRQYQSNKRVEVDLESSRVSLQTVLDSIPAEMAILNNQGVIIACNQIWLKFGIHKPKLPGFPALGAPVGTHYVKTCKELDSGYLIDEKIRFIKQGCGVCNVLEGNLFHFNKEYKREDGSLAWHQIDATPIGKNGVNGVILMHTDISERKQSEEKLRISNSMKRAVLKSSPCAIMAISTLGYFDDYNPATIEMFDYSKNEFASKDRTWLDLLIPKRLHEDDRLALSNYKDTSENSTSNQFFESTGLRQNGQEFPIELTITPTPIRAEENNFYSVFIRDLTTFKQAEATLKNGLLEAKQANTVKSQFLAMMSHEIRTPLNAILGMQDLLVNTPLDIKQTEYLQIATQAGALLLRLVNDILDLTKVESGKLDLEKLDFDAVLIVELCMQLLAVEAQEKGLALHTIIAPEVNTWISGDPYRFRQIILNLVSNAIKFTEKGSVTVKLSADPLADTTCLLLVEVIDTGIGIPEDLQSGLFEVFVQADPSDTRKYGGSGLGLAISKQLVTLWGGQIGIDSTPSVGSRFWFTVGAKAVTPEQRLISTIKPGNSNIPNTLIARVLLVEDSLLNQAVMAAMLRNGGHQVDLADCGAKGIEAASEKDYDIILMDVSMPDMSGMEATAIIRQLGGTVAKVPIIAITAHALAGYQEMCLASGMNGYATKPISQKDLLALVGIWCTNKDTQATEVISTLVKDSSALSIEEYEIKINKVILDELTFTLGELQVKELLQIYLTELNTRCETIKQAIITQDLSVLSREGHTIKSSSATFGATSLQALGKELEACGYNDDLATALLVAKRLLPCAEATVCKLMMI